MALLLYSVREFWKPCQTSLRAMLCLFKITKTSQAFLTVLCNKANLLAVHYSWDGKNLLMVSCWLSTRQWAVPSPPPCCWIPTPSSAFRGSAGHHPLENVLIETASVKVWQHCLPSCQGKKCFKGHVCLLEYIAMLCTWSCSWKLVFICRKHRWNRSWTFWESQEKN